MALVSETARRAPTVGDVVGARFRLERELGAGGMGTVYEAVDLRTDVRVALKIMRPELADDEAGIERFRREGAALATVDHPSVVKVREVGEAEDGTLFLAMELLAGETLSERIAREGRMSVEQLLPVVLGLCAGLDAVHAAGIIHRDIKPSNIHLPASSPFEDSSTERMRRAAPVKLVDFGVARVRGFSKMTSTGLAVGTVRYMAPEQLTGSAIDARADIYALGTVVYEALAGEHPFLRVDDPVGAILVGRAPPLSSLRPDLPPAITQVVDRAMARLATARFASAGELADAFHRAALDPALAETQLVPSVRPPPREAAPLSPFAPTALATPSVRPVPPTASGMRARTAPATTPASAPKRRRAPVWLLLPLLIGVCAVPTFGVAGFVGCGNYVIDVQMRTTLRDVRASVDADPSLAEFGAELDTLDSLHEREHVNLFAATALNARVQHVLKNDHRIGPEEVPWIMEVVRDINERDGDYTLEHYSEMTEETRSR